MRAMMTLPFLLGLFVLMLHVCVAVKSAAQSCKFPTLENGYFYPHRSHYSNDEVLTYSCDSGYIPPVDGWWASSTCKSGRWFDEPQCIAENNCAKPSIPNAIKIEVEARTIEFTCKSGYKPKIPECENGSWSFDPVCEKSVGTCDGPEKVPHAVVIHEKYQELFDAGTKLQYKCKEGYRAEGSNTKVTCGNGKWSVLPTCQKIVSEMDGSTIGTGGSITPSTGGGVNRCGEKPFVTNGEIVETGSDYLKYECALYYKLEGSDTVRCLRDGSWTPVPSCREAFCYVNTEDYPLLISDGTELLGEGEKKRLKCVEPFGFSSQYSEFQCISNGLVKHTDCCTKVSLDTNFCTFKSQLG